MIYLPTNVAKTQDVPLDGTIFSSNTGQKDRATFMNKNVPIVYSYLKRVETYRNQVLQHHLTIQNPDMIYLPTNVAKTQDVPQRYKEWQHYSYRGKQYVPPNALWFWKGYLTIGCPVKTAVHDCSLALTYSFRNMPQILYVFTKKMHSDRSKVQMYSLFHVFLVLKTNF